MVAVYARLLELGASAFEPITEVGKGIKVAAVQDPFGNRLGLIENPADAELWMEMIRSLNQSSHTYNLEQARAITRDVIDRFHPAFGELKDHFAALADAQR